MVLIYLIHFKLHSFGSDVSVLNVSFHKCEVKSCDNCFLSGRRITIAVSIAMVTGSARREIYEINMNMKIEPKSCDYFHISAVTLVKRCP